MSWLAGRFDKAIEKLGERLLYEFIAWMALGVAWSEYLGVGRLGIG